jgi:hypothetical protein
MDEYDVFLDQVSRRVTLRELQNYALDPNQEGRQFIIVTPQDLSGIISSNDVRHVQMPAPTRTARAHDAVQATLDESGFGT